MNAVSKLSFKMLLLLQILTDCFDYSQESCLGCSAFGLCSAWQNGAFATINKMFLYIVTQEISLGIRLCGYLSEVQGSDVIITVRAQIQKHT